MKSKNVILAITTLFITGCSQENRVGFQVLDEGSSQAPQRFASISKSDARAIDARKRAVKTPRELAHEAMASSVKTALSKASGLDASNILVKPRGTTIDLQGSVIDRDQAKQACQIARGMAGHDYNVNNQLAITSQ